MSERIYSIKRTIRIEGEKPEEDNLIMHSHRPESVGREILIAGLISFSIVLLLGLVMSR